MSFLCNRGQVRADNFTDSSYVAQGLTKKHLSMLNNQITHLGSLRTIRADEKISQVDRADMHQLLLRQLTEFDRCLKPEWRVYWKVLPLWESVE